MARKSSSTSEQKGFDAIGRFSEKGQKPFRPFMDRLFAKRVSSAHLSRDWASDTDWARMQQEPIRARLFLYTVLLTVVALLVWAYFASIDEVTRGAGRVIPASQLQRIQSFDGGVIEQIFIREGQIVEAGQVLMQIDPTRFVSDFAKTALSVMRFKRALKGCGRLRRGLRLNPPKSSAKKYRILWPRSARSMRAAAKSCANRKMYLMTVFVSVGKSCERHKLAVIQLNVRSIWPVRNST